MAVWNARTWVPAAPDEVLALLVEPDAIGRWSPIPFEVADHVGGRLSAGDCIRVRGSLLGRALEFEVDVAQAHGGRLGLTATGPIRLDVQYLMETLEDGTQLTATVGVSGRGLLGGRWHRRPTRCLPAARWPVRQPAGSRAAPGGSRVSSARAARAASGAVD